MDSVFHTSVIYVIHVLPYEVCSRRINQEEKRGGEIGDSRLRRGERRVDWKGLESGEAKNGRAGWLGLNRFQASAGFVPSPGNHDNEST